MPRPGGESDKLGNRYEGIWTIGRLLELASGQSAYVTVEPINDEIGIEFIVKHNDSAVEFHSVKRQRAKGEWSIAALSTKDTKTGRSIFTDLFGKLSTNEGARVCFVSSTGANDIRELSERALAR